MSSPKVYTRTGDQGKTSLIGGTRVSKAHLRLETYGTIDELNSVIGVVIASAASESDVQVILQRVQSDLFDIGSHLACEDAQMREKLPLIHEDHIAELETFMDTYSTSLPALKNFVLPGGSLAASHTHIARTVCRRAERLCVALSESATDGAQVEPLITRYLNRLSDYLFVLARKLNYDVGVSEVLWAPRKKG